MALTKKEKSEIKELKSEIQELFQKAVSHGKSYAKDKYKQTEKRLYAYPVLCKNIERYKLDIEDVKSENFGRSKSIVVFSGGSGGEQIDIEDVRKAKIKIIEAKISRDEQEIKEIDAALEIIKDDEYYKIIELKYFKNICPDDIIKVLNCDRATFFRNRKRLINSISISLYGANAL